MARTDAFVGHVSAGALDTGPPDETRKMLFVVPGVVIVDDVGGDISVNDVQPSSWKFRAAAHITRQREGEYLALDRGKTAGIDAATFDPQHRFVAAVFDAISAGGALGRRFRCPRIGSPPAGVPPPNGDQAILYQHQLCTPRRDQRPVKPDDRP